MQRQTHKLLAVLLAVIMILSAAPTVTFTAFAETEGIFTYSIYNGEIVLTGLTDKSYSGELNIPSTLGGYPVASIGDNAFSGCTGLTSVTIPDSVTSIGGNAFRGCAKLKYIAIPNSVTSIGWYAFYGCTGLMSVTIGNSVTLIGDAAFYGCIGLTSVTIPNSVNSIGEYAFSGCTGLMSVTIGNSVTFIGFCAFDHCTGLTSIIIPDSVTSIGLCAFGYCAGLESITVNDGNTIYHSKNNCLIETESKTLLAGCKNSAIPTDGSVISITAYTFRGCTGLKSIKIPDSVTSIDYGAFIDCAGITSITIPDSVISIGDGAFSHCAGLTSVTIGNSVTSIGVYVFYNCDGLKDVYYTGTEKQKNKISINADKNDYLLNATWHYNCNPDVPDACAHNDTVWKVITKPVLTENGLKRELCSNCGKILDEAEIPALGVTYDIENAAKNEAENVSVAVSAESNLPETVEVVAEKAEVTEDSITYEIHLENEGEQIQPNATVLVKLPIPAGFDKNILNVYRKEADGSKTRMDITVDGDFAYFETDHFSIYEILEKLCGDINNDDKVNNKDLTRLFQYLSKWNVEVNEAALDVNGDGKVNNKDLTRLFQYLSKWDVEIF